VLGRPDGTRVLTLTRFATDPGPDLRVYVVPGDGSDVSGAVDVAALEGNVGNQQYDLPDGTDAGAVVIWCRAFSVAFGTAALS
jgi:Electron transfer DM13